MHGLASAILLFFFVLSTFVVVASYSLGFILNSEYLKSRLNQGDIYSAFVSGLNEQARARDAERNVQTTLAEKKFDGNYLKGKVEFFLDETFLYLEGRKSEIPEINFEDLLTAKEKAELGGKEVKLELANAENLRVGYQNLKRAPLVFSLISFVILVLLFFLGTTWASKVRKVSTALFIASFWGFVTTLLVLGASNILVETISSLVSGGEFNSLSGPIRTALKPVPSVLGEKMALSYAALLVFAVLLLVASFLIHTRREALQNLKVAQENFLKAIDNLQRASSEESRKEVANVKNEAELLRTKIYRQLLKQTPPETK